MPDINMPAHRISPPDTSKAAPSPPPPTPTSTSTPTSTPTKRRGLWIALLVLILAAGAGGAWWWSSQGKAPEEAAAPPPMKVPVHVVGPRTVPVYRSFPATTESMRTVPIQAQVTGYLVERGAADGADVAKDALLYRIDPRDYQALVAQSAGQRDSAEASLRYSRANQGRNSALARDGWTSRDNADRADSTLLQGQASLDSNTASLRAAAINLSRTELRAPFAGRISRSQVFEGSLISVAGTTLNTLVQLDPIYVAFNPAESNLEAINREQGRAPIETSVTVPSSETSHAGTVTFLDNQVDRQTGTILVRATIANPDRALLPGQFVTARLHLGDLKDALLVPQGAIASSQLGRTVLVIGKEDKAELRVVKLGDSYDDMIVVTDGVKAGDRVITGQLQKLKPGAAVEAEAPKP
ncbi:MAG: efflux RND transporter periplasmic adaptor subunit [Gemmatimonadaceae bacterium]|nr:efflux RND transporter periplasmic adaptor subunit [Acetobacteraceae bacterium]